MYYNNKKYSSFSPIPIWLERGVTKQNPGIRSTSNGNSTQGASRLINGANRHQSFEKTKKHAESKDMPQKTHQNLECHVSAPPDIRLSSLPRSHSFGLMKNPIGQRENSQNKLE